MLLLSFTEEGKADAELLDFNVELDRAKFEQRGVMHRFALLVVFHHSCVLVFRSDMKIIEMEQKLAASEKKADSLYCGLEAAVNSARQDSAALRMFSSVISFLFLKF